MRRHHFPWICASLVGAAACATTPLGTPGVEARRVAQLVAEGDSGAAARHFARATDPDYRDRMYPVLYGRAQDHYEAGDTAQAAALLGFMQTHYPDSDAVAEARLYALFLERASVGTDADVGEELDAVLAGVLENDSSPPTWIELVRAQRAIDRDRLPEAREALAAFRSAWDGSPTELAVYVDDLGRFLQSDSAAVEDAR